MIDDHEILPDAAVGSQPVLGGGGAGTGAGGRRYPGCPPDQCVQGEILPHTDVAVRKGRIALVGDARGCIGPQTRVVDAEGRYLAPGFLDGHIHVESSMLTVREYARAVVPHGTVGIYMDPHEIANVLGLPGVSMMMEEAEGTPLKVMMTTPSCVP